MHCYIPLTKAHEGVGVNPSICWKEGDESSSPHLSSNLHDWSDQPFHSNRGQKRKASVTDHTSPPQKKRKKRRCHTRTNTIQNQHKPSRHGTFIPPNQPMLPPSNPFKDLSPSSQVSHSTDDLSSLYLSHRQLIMSHEQDGLVLCHGIYLRNLEPLPPPLKHLRTTFKNPTQTIPPIPDYMNDHPTFVQHNAFHSQAFHDDGSIKIAHLSISPGFFNELSPNLILPQVKIMANVNVCHMSEITTQNSLPIDLVMNSSMSSTPMCLTTMNTLFFVFLGEYNIYISPGCKETNWGFQPSGIVMDPHEFYQIGEESKLKCQYGVTRHVVKAGCSIFLPQGYRYTIFRVAYSVGARIYIGESLHSTSSNTAFAPSAVAAAASTSSPPSVAAAASTSSPQSDYSSGDEETQNHAMTLGSGSKLVVDGHLKMAAKKTDSITTNHASEESADVGHLKMPARKSNGGSSESSDQPSKSNIVRFILFVHGSVACE
jgi:hypothetical protein